MSVLLYSPLLSVRIYRGAVLTSARNSFNALAESDCAMTGQDHTYLVNIVPKHNIVQVAGYVPLRERTTDVTVNGL